MKIKILILLLSLGFGASAQTYTNVGSNGLQRKVSGSDTTFRHNLGSAGFLYTKSFDLTAFRMEGQNSLPLNIVGWDKQIMYKY